MRVDVYARTAAAQPGIIGRVAQQHINVTTKFVFCMGFVVKAIYRYL